MPLTMMLIFSDSLRFRFLALMPLSVCLKHIYTCYTMTCLNHDYVITADNLVSDPG